MKFFEISYEYSKPVKGVTTIAADSMAEAVRRFKEQQGVEFISNMTEFSIKELNDDEVR